MLKIFILTALILFSGCHDPIKPPHIESLGTRPPIKIRVYQGCVCGEDKDALMNEVVNLRKDNTYYFNAIRKYNKNFADK